MSRAGVEAVGRAAQVGRGAFERGLEPALVLRGHPEGTPAAAALVERLLGLALALDRLAILVGAVLGRLAGGRLAGPDRLVLVGGVAEVAPPGRCDRRGAGRSSAPGRARRRDPNESRTTPASRRRACPLRMTERSRPKCRRSAGRCRCRSDRGRRNARRRCRRRLSRPEPDGASPSSMFVGRGFEAVGILETGFRVRAAGEGVRDAGALGSSDTGSHSDEGRFGRLARGSGVEAAPEHGEAPDGVAVG